MKIINLLPRHKQEELRYEAMFHSVSIALGIAVVILVAVWAGQWAARWYLDAKTASIQGQIEQIKRSTNKQENNDLKAKIRLINAQLTDFKNLADATPDWSKVLVAFARQVPDGVRIGMFTADAATKKVTITGQSPTRDQVIQLYNNISQDSGNFRDIDYPLENVAKPADVAFHFTFYLKDELLKPQ